MINFFTIFNEPPYIDRPFNLFGWIAWISMLAILLGWILRGRKNFYGVSKKRWVIFAILLFMVPFSEMFFGFRLPGDGSLPPAGIPIEQRPQTVLILSALPWILSAGILGPVMTALVALTSGFFRAITGTHNLFSLFDIVPLAIVFSYFVRQRYRTKIYLLLRHPIISSAVLALASIPIYFITAALSANGNLAVRLDSSLMSSWLTIVTMSFELLAAGLVAEILYLIKFKYWGGKGDPLPSPSESSLKGRLFFGIFPILVIILIVIVIADWVVSEKAAQDLIKNRISSAAVTAAESLPFFVETGQSLMNNISNPDWLVSSQVNTRELENQVRSVPFFKDVLILDGNGGVRNSYPSNPSGTPYLTDQERTGISLALKGVTNQTYFVPPMTGDLYGEISFIMPIRDKQNQIVGAAVGHTGIDSNPFTEPIIKSFSSVGEIDGSALIVDQDKQIIFHTGSSLAATDYQEAIPEDSGFFLQVSQNGRRELIYFQPVKGLAWGIIIKIPIEYAHGLAIKMALPILLLVASLILVLWVFWKFVLQKITKAIVILTSETAQISKGNLNVPITISGYDELGRLCQSLDEIRQSLRTQFEELNHFLQISQGVASSLQPNSALRLILEAVIKDGIASARVVLSREGILDSSVYLSSFGLGPEADRYAGLDGQLFELMKQQDVLTIPNTIRMRRPSFSGENESPGALICFSLRDEGNYYGIFWIAFRFPHVFTEEENRYYNALAGEATLAAANAKIFASAEIGRQRFAAVVECIPEPILVIDTDMRLLMINTAALDIPDLALANKIGRPINEVIIQHTLLDFIAQNVDDRILTREIILSGGSVYNASLTKVMAEGQALGKVCILHDITSFKDLDMLKSEFVSTVSHDLRGPLALMNGYATMIQMVGELNSQQKGYAAKILYGVEDMNRLVNNLLDLNRVEKGIGLKMEKVVGARIIENTVTSLQAQATQKKIQLGFEVPSLTPVVIEADPALLQQALYNLIENAIKYTQVGGQVKIKLQSKISSAIFEIYDTGIGIAPLDLPHMFEKFYRGDNRENSHQRGSGLGLAIVRSIAERHHGNVWVESQLGKGSVFFLEIPLRQ
jgi:signal transduction histidine kinase